MTRRDHNRFPPLLTDYELHLHGEGTHYQSYDTLGARLMKCEGEAGVRFAVWAPNAKAVSVVGDFNDWDSRRHPMRLRSGGIWEIFVPELGEQCTLTIVVLFHFFQDGGCLSNSLLSFSWREHFPCTPAYTEHLM